MITVSQDQKDEWARFAQACYNSGKTSLGNCFSVMASAPDGTRIPVKNYDNLQEAYREWLERLRVTRRDAHIKVSLCAL